MGRLVRRAGLLIALAAAVVAAEAMAQPTIDRILNVDILPGDTPDTPSFQVEWQSQASPLVSFFHMILGYYDGGDGRILPGTLNRHPSRDDIRVRVVDECYVPAVTGQTIYSCTARSDGLYPLEAGRSDYILRVYGYNTNRVLVDLSHNDPPQYLRVIGLLPNGIREDSATGPGTLPTDSGQLNPLPAGAFPAVLAPSLTLGADLSRDGGVVPQAGRPVVVQLDHLRASETYRLLLQLAFSPSISSDAARAASGWDGVCGRGSWQTVIRGQTSWTATARLRACGRPPWPPAQTGTATITYSLDVITGYRPPAGQPEYENVSTGNLTALRLMYPMPTPTPRPTAGPGVQPVADAWFDPVASLGEDVIGLGGDTTKAAIVGALAMGAVVLAYRFSGNIGVSVLGGVLVVIGGVPIGLTPIWVLAGTALAGIVVSGFIFFFRGDGI